ncbi:MAG: hypothetical protein KJ571_05345 [Bacteroidetes bacterium]|nr:hypothetical protein [Bacteroidota bacterium]
MRNYTAANIKLPINLNGLKYLLPKDDSIFYSTSKYEKKQHRYKNNPINKNLNEAMNFTYNLEEIIKTSHRMQKPA